MPNKKNQEINCPEFDNRRESYVEWKGKVDDWIGVVGEKVDYKGIILRSVLTGEAWNLVSGIPGEELIKKDGWKAIIDIMDKKYGEDKKKEKLRIMDEIYKVERKNEESISDFISRFDQLVRNGTSCGMKDLDEEHKGSLLLGRAKLNEQDRKMMDAVLEDDRNYQKVNDTLMRVFHKRENLKEKLWMEGRSEEKTMTNKKCFNCNEEGHISWQCKRERRIRKIKKCKGCERNGHEIEECWFKDRKCYKCQQMGHVASQCNKESENEGKDTKKDERVFYGEEQEVNEENFETICGIIDTGCRPTIVGEL